MTSRRIPPARQTIVRSTLPILAVLLIGTPSIVRAQPAPNPTPAPGSGGDPVAAPAPGTQPRAAGILVAEIAQRPRRAAGAPRSSDVCFSPRFRRPHNAHDPHETLRDAKTFHATRFDWVYSSDPKWIAQCRQLGYGFTGALNTILADAPGAGTREKGRILDKNGDRIAAPWMRAWTSPGYWGCVNSPAYRETFLAHARLLIDGGVDAIQMDDPGINVAAVAWGGCHCEHCRVFLNPEDCADLYGFVRANASRLDGYEDAAVAGCGLEEDRYPDGAPARTAEADVFVAVRARPGEPDAPIVIQLVDWRETPGPFRLALRTAAFFGARPVQAALQIPPAYDREAHAQAAAGGDYSALTKPMAVSTTVNGSFTELAIPALNPWAIVVVQPRESSSGELR